MFDSSIVISDWRKESAERSSSQLALFSSDAMAAATRIESNSPFCVAINGRNYLAYKRHASAVISGLMLSDMVMLLKNMDLIRNDLIAMGVRAISLNSCNADGNLSVLPELVDMHCKLRFEFLLDTEEYSLSNISSNHRRNIKKSQKIDAQIVLGNGISAVQSHIDMVNSNLSKKGVGGLTNSPEYFQCLVDQGAGILVQVKEGDQLLASTFFLVNDDFAYYHSSGASEHGRKSGAAHFLVDGMINEMRGRQIRYLNFGGCRSEQSGLYRFKMGFRPRTHILFSAHRQLDFSVLRKLRLLLASRPSDILNIVKLPVYLKSSLDSTSDEGDEGDDYVCRTMSIKSICEAVSDNPELGESLLTCTRSGSHCYALEGKKGEIIAIGFIVCNGAQGPMDKMAHKGTPSSAQVSNIYVIQSMRNQGVGKALLCFLELQISNMDYEQAYSKIDADNDVAKAMFRSRGFQLLGEETIFYSKFFGEKQRVLGRIEL